MVLENLDIPTLKKQKRIYAKILQPSQKFSKKITDLKVKLKTIKLLEGINK